MPVIACTPTEFVTIFGLTEAVELTNIVDPNATTVNFDRLQMALDDAKVWLENYLAAAPPAATELVYAGARRVTAIVARYFLDTLRTRENVKVDFEACVKEIDQQLKKADQAVWHGRDSRGAGLTYNGKVVSLVRFTQQRPSAYTHESLEGYRTMNTYGDPEFTHIQIVSPLDGQ